MGVLLLVVGLLAIFGGLAVVVVTAASGVSERAAVGRSLASIEAIQTGPAGPQGDTFGDRVLTPAMERLTRAGRRLTGQETTSSIRRRLDLAGNPPGWDADRVIAFKALGALVGAVVGLLLGVAVGNLLVTVGVLAVLVLLGFFAPDLVLYQTAYNRTDRMRKDLPDALDLMTISVEAGLSFDSAVSQVARNTTGPLADEFFRVLQEMQIGTGRADAIRALGERTDLAELRGFTSAMIQADTLGIPIADVLRVQAHELRLKRSQRAEEQAQKVPVKILFPLIFCILPPLFIAILGPAAIEIITNFSTAG